jgi:riboflavin biosynthesis pyrimidine reductase
MTTTTIWHVTMSLDGFIAGPQDEVSWGFGHGARRPEAANRQRVGIFGANVARQIIAAGLLDEIVAHVVPVLPGDGVRLYGSGDPTVKLERVDATLSLRITDLRFRVNP